MLLMMMMIMMMMMMMVVVLTIFSHVRLQLQSAIYSRRHDSGGLSPTFHITGLEVNPGQSVWDCWRKTWQCDSCIFDCLGFFLSISFHHSSMLVHCVRKVAVRLQKLLEVMSTSVYTGLNPFNFIRKHFLQICLWDVSYIRNYCSF